MEKSLALVLRLVEFSESSYIATLYTDNFGKISGLAKGARRRKSPFESALDLLSMSRIVFIPKRSDVLDLLTEARLERRFRSASRNLARLYAGLYVAELLDALTDQGDPNRALFQAARDTMQNLDEEGNVAAWVAWFELRLLKLVGHLPQLEMCVECGGAADADDRPVAFGHAAGGLLCTRCKQGQRQLVRLQGATIRQLQSLAQAQLGPPAEVQMPAGVGGELRGLINQYVANLLGRRLRMTSWLHI